jgi:hypothetical protein
VLPKSHESNSSRRMTTGWREVGKLHLVCQGAMCGRQLVWVPEQAYYQCPTRAPNCRFVERPWGELTRCGEDCGAVPRLRDAKPIGDLRSV